MKTLVKITLILFVMYGFQSCSKNETPAPEPIAQPEPEQLLGAHSAPTPQDYVLGGLSGCMMVTFVAMCSMKDIQLESVTLDIKSGLDLQGFLGVNETSPVGFDTIKYTFTVKGNGTDAQYQEAADEVIKFSPNYATMANKVKMVASLNVLESKSA